MQIEKKKTFSIAKKKASFKWKRKNQVKMFEKLQHNKTLTCKKMTQWHKGPLHYNMEMQNKWALNKKGKKQSEKQQKSFHTKLWHVKSFDTREQQKFIQK